MGQCVTVNVGNEGAVAPTPTDLPSEILKSGIEHEKHKKSDDEDEEEEEDVCGCIEDASCLSCI